MFLYIISIFLIITYNYSCLGVPLQNVVLSERLSALASSCATSFISTQIQAKLSECDVKTTLLNDKQIQCLLFYDINQRLCKAIAAGKLGLPDDYSSAINEAIDVEDTCKLAPNWNFTDLADFPNYKKNVLQVFHLKLNIGCLKVCGVPEVTSQDTNFFCKYFKWGLETLDSPLRVQDTSKIKLNNVNATSTQIVTTGDAKSLQNPEEIIKYNVSFPSGPAAAIGDILGSNITTKLINDDSSSSKAQSGLSKTDLSTSKNKALPSDNQSNHEIDGHNSKTSSDVEVKTSPSHSEKPLQIVETNVFDKPSAAGIEMSNKEDEPNNDELEKALPMVPKETTNKKLKPVDQPEPDYNDSEEAKDGLVDGDDNGDDPSMGMEVETKPEPTTPEKNKGVDTSMLFVEKELNPMQEQFANDDDHFFPFFLTGIILVVLLYILYHNKSKVSKVVLGLIVEGRQPGRRRNSRGHAYRRLDTLEQAMSTNSAAPPSKIIY